MGMGILDLAVADYVYNEARSSNLCIEIDNFFNSND
jgi:ornithine cyclodeaminase/alanine dehydrogenase-like protein (mu-crystallin family)